MRIEAENLVKYRKSVNKTLFLTLVMERHGVEWEQKGTHEKHLTIPSKKSGCWPMQPNSQNCASRLMMTSKAACGLRLTKAESASG